MDGHDGGADDDMATTPPPLLENDSKCGDVNGESLRDLDPVLLPAVSGALPIMLSSCGEPAFERFSNHALRRLGESAKYARERRKRTLTLATVQTIWSGPNGTR